MAFDGEIFCNYGNNYATNVITFGVDNSSTFHTDNCKDNFSVFGEGLTYCINGTFHQRKGVVLILVKQGKRI